MIFTRQAAFLFTALLVCACSDQPQRLPSPASPVTIPATQLSTVVATPTNPPTPIPPASTATSVPSPIAELSPTLDATTPLAGAALHRPDRSAAQDVLPAVSPTDIFAPTQARVIAAVPVVPSPTQSAASPSPQPTPVPATPLADSNFLLPDLQVLPPSDLVIQVSSPDGRKLLRFTNSVVNGGPGVLELLGVLNPATEKTVVTQHIYYADNTVKEQAAGEFVFHPGHDHWHLENFARYEVWSLVPVGDLNALVALTDKVSYCLRDNTRADIPNASIQPVYTKCNQELQGIAVGWIDTYKFDTAGQIVDITGVPDGMYALRSIVDPINQLWELDDANNAATVYLEINGDRVRIVESSTVLIPLVIAND